MKLKHKKQDVLNNIINRVQYSSHIPNDSYSSYSGYSNYGNSEQDKHRIALIQALESNMNFKIQQAIIKSFREAFEELIENIYTDEEFEQDIGLTK